MSRLTIQLAEIQDIVNQLSLLERRHFVAKSPKKENVAEHSLSVAMLAWYLHHYTKSMLDLQRIQEYAIIHDFVEIHAGDVHTFASPDERAAKEESERAALELLKQDFDNFPDLTGALENYQNMADEEARFTWTADKIQSLIQGHSDNWRPYYLGHITNEQFSDKMKELGAQVHPDLQELFEEIVSWCKQSYNYSPDSNG